MSERIEPPNDSPTKVCSRCGIELDVSEFYLAWNRKTLRGQCKRCCIEITLDNRERRQTPQ